MTKEVTIYRDKGYQVKAYETQYDNDNMALSVEVQEDDVMGEVVLFLTPQEMVSMGYKMIEAGRYMKGEIIDIKA